MWALDSVIVMATGERRIGAPADVPQQHVPAPVETVFAVILQVKIVQVVPRIAARAAETAPAIMVKLAPLVGLIAESAAETAFVLTVKPAPLARAIAARAAETVPAITGKPVPLVSATAARAAEMALVIMARTAQLVRRIAVAHVLSVEMGPVTTEKRAQIVLEIVDYAAERFTRSQA